MPPMRRAAPPRRSPASSPIRPAESFPAPTSSRRTRRPRPSRRAVTAVQGAFTIPALNVGTYTVTVSLTGLQDRGRSTTSWSTPACPRRSRRCWRSAARRKRSLTVQSSSEVVQTDVGATVSSTLSVNQITKLPLTSRNALDFVVNLPGVNTPGGSARFHRQRPAAERDQHHARRHEHPGQLPEDDRRLLRAPQPAARRGRGSHGDHGGQRRRQRRPGRGARSASPRASGTNDLQRQLLLLPAARRAERQHLVQQPRPDAGSATGKAPQDRAAAVPARHARRRPDRDPGPLRRPRTRRSSSSTTRTRASPSHEHAERGRSCTPEAQPGIFRYTAAADARRGEPAAARRPRTARPRRSIRRSRKLLADIRAATATTGADHQPLGSARCSSYTFQSADRATSRRRRRCGIDYNLSKNHRLTGSFNYQHINSNPDTTNSQRCRFPGFPIYGSQQSTRYTTSESLRSTFGTEPRQRAARRRHRRRDALLAREERRRCSAASASATRAAFLPRHQRPPGITNAGVTPTPSSREASTKNIEDTLNWLKGTHNLSIGGVVHAGRPLAARTRRWSRDQLRHRHRRPGRRRCSRRRTSRARRTRSSPRARNLYARAHRPRLVEIAGNARLNEDTNEYEYLGDGFQRGRMREFGFFVQDTWRVRAEPDRQRRPALRAAAAVLLAQQQLLDGDARGRLRRLGRRPRRLQPVQAGHADRAASRRSPTTRRARPRSTPTGTTSRRRSA